jgi:dTDP-glucose pyrophosphorylase
MKAVILAAGRGKRLKEITAPINKCMLKFDDKRLIEYSLRSAFLSNVEKIIIIVGYRAEDIINAYGISYQNIRIQYVFQEVQKGLVHAIEQAKEALDGDDFILFLADELLLNPEPSKMIKTFYEKDLFALCGVTEVTDREQIKKTYSVIYDPESNSLYRLIEKPRNPFSNIMGTGNCIFRYEIFDLIPYTPINYFRQEKELPDLIQCAIDDGKRVQMFFIDADYVNINTPEDIEIAKKISTRE